MPADLLEQLGRLGDHYERSVAPITISEVDRGAAKAETDVPIDELQERRDRPPRRRYRLVGALAAAAAVLVGVAGIALLADGTTPSPVAPGDGPAASTRPVGLFPTRPGDGATMTGYSTPQAVAKAYLDDRTRPENLPDGYSARAQVTGDPIELGAGRALVPFELRTVPDYDTGDGRVLVQSTTAADGTESWYVVAAAVRGISTTITFEGRDLDVDYAAGGGITDIAVIYQDVRGPRVGWWGQSTVDFGDGAVGPPRPERHDVNLDEPVAVRLWNIGEPESGRLRAMFSEQVVAREPGVWEGGFEALDRLRTVATNDPAVAHNPDSTTGPSLTLPATTSPPPARPPTIDGPVTAATLGNGEIILIDDDGTQKLPYSLEPDVQPTGEEMVIDSVAVMGDGRVYLSMCCETEAGMFVEVGDDELTTQPGHGLDVSPDGTRLASVGSHELTVRDADAQPIASITTDADDPYAVMWIDDERLAVLWRPVGLDETRLSVVTPETLDTFDDAGAIVPYNGSSEEGAPQRPMSFAGTSTTGSILVLNGDVSDLVIAFDSATLQRRPDDDISLAGVGTGAAISAWVEQGVLSWVGIDDVLNIDGEEVSGPDVNPGEFRWVRRFS